MSRIDDLINELCPDGVEYKDLQNLCGTITTGRLNANAMEEDGLYPFFTCDSNPFKINTYAFDEEAILISGNGSQVGHINYYNGKFNAYQRTYVIYDFKEINVKFLLHYLKGFLKEYILKNCKKGSVPYITLPMLQNFSVPVPPMEVQCEIVHVLDDFTSLSEEILERLSAELKDRQKQHEYYAEKLLSFYEVESKTLGELGNFYGGLSGKSKLDFINGNKKFISYMNVFKNIEVDIDTDDKVNIEINEKQNKLEYGDIIFTGSSENIEECGMSSVLTKQIHEETYLNSFCFYFRFNDTNIMLPSFSKYLFRSNNIRKQLIKTANGVTRFNVSKKKMEKVIIPLPPLNIQEKIVSILDDFYKLEDNISKELQIEIEARQKQYEYYRNKILTFKEIKVNE